MEFLVDECRVTVNVPDWAALDAAVSGRLAARRGFSLATLNLDHLVKLAGSRDFRTAYAAQDFVTADGNPIVWMSRLAGKPVSLVPGSDAILPICRIAARMEVPVALVGSSRPTLAAAKAHLEEAVPGLTVALTHAPDYGFDPEGAAAEDVIAQIRDSGARLCFLALSAPKQEMFAVRARDRLGEVGFVSIGAGLDFFSGEQRRAPKLVRRLALEWLWRMAMNPARLGPRYLRCAAILPGQAAQALGQRFRAA
ncbi:WecB/TagA/CpsF family glycosyltransferase [Litorisediminicola beolgyonensis]|uniref:WecB/TagA/CpsF family glycosyltransferase n=1 Tax=Litorisediminicola beolgyonensis TaxID=1173614 RepID=A0ABW3ZHY2_9RHOB